MIAAIVLVSAYVVVLILAVMGSEILADLISAAIRRRSGE